MSNEDFRQRVLIQLDQIDKRFDQIDRFQKEVLNRFDLLDRKIDGKIDGLRDEMNGRFAALTLNLIRAGAIKSEDVYAQMLPLESFEISRREGPA